MAILGIDEVGRGPLAGPLVVGAVILPESRPEWVDRLRDSKRLNARSRRELSELIVGNELTATGLGWVSAGEIDRLGMIGALKLASKRAVKMIQKWHLPFSQIVIDGNINFLEGTSLEKYVSTVIKGDNLIKEISAASIIAKVARDDYMRKIAQEYPGYGFERHMGYGTELHRKMMRERGLCPEHRRLVKLVKEIAMRDGEDVSWVWQKETKKNTTLKGRKGEDATCDYLEELGHTILARNFKTRFYEIDIISIFEGKIYFTEVKYRRSDVAGGGIGAINRSKLEQMEFASECFLQFRSDLKNEFDPMLAVAEVEGEDYRVKEWMALG